MLTSSQLSDIKSAKLNIINGDGDVLRTMNLTRCSQSLLSDPVDFPLGEISYQLVGRDTNDINFRYNTRKNANFAANATDIFLFTITGPLRIEMEPYEILTLTYTLNSRASYSSPFEFRVERVSGFATLVGVQTRQVRVSPGESIEIEVLVRRSSSSIRRGTSHVLTISGSNGCVNVSASTTLHIREQV